MHSRFHTGRLLFLGFKKDRGRQPKDIGFGPTGQDTKVYEYHESVEIHFYPSTVKIPDLLSLRVKPLHLGKAGFM